VVTRVAADPIVVKLGGRALENQTGVAELAADLRAMGGHAIVVHGGGAEASAWCSRLGITPRLEDGLRVTDEATLEVVAAVLGGLANQRLVAALRANGLDAIGLSALDGGLVEVERHPNAARLGHVGSVRSVRAALLEEQFAAGRVPVLASIGALEGALLNLNADDLAVAVAGALGARALILLSDTPGVRLGGTIVPELTSSDLAAVLSSDDVQGGMIAKLRAVSQAMSHVHETYIAAWSGPGTLRRLLAGTLDGTRITNAPRTEVATG
jgi:acetylglutamate kinase